MHSNRIENLIRSLDGLSDSPTLLQISRMLENANLEFADIEPFVKTSKNNYNRTLVVQRENYELLVLTWSPGQESSPHDHSGSVSAMQVMSGVAKEKFWRISDDGYADVEYESILQNRKITAWHDAGVHSIGNADESQILVTVHVYAPKLREFRRYRVRPTSARPNLRVINDQSTVLVVGGGFSGSVTAAQLLRRSNLANFPLHVVLVERGGCVGEGVAYGTQEEMHLLNVPASRMSAWPDKPNDFSQWVTQRYGVHDQTAFVQRKWYGEYVRETLLNVANERGGVAKLTILYDEVRRLTKRSDNTWLVSFKKGSSLSCDTAVIAIGHRSPSDPIGKNWSGPRKRFIQDPWQSFAIDSIDPDKAVVILGAGLTALDTALTLSDTDRTAPIIMLSRRGLVPQSHSVKPVSPVNMEFLVEICSSGKTSLRHLMKAIREQVLAITANGGDWRSVVDGLRPHTAILWQSLSLSDRQRFMRHLRPFWEIHRHRTAVGVSERFHELVNSSKIKIMSGRVSACHANENDVRLFVRERGQERLLELHAGCVINCTGPSASNNESHSVWKRLRQEARSISMEM